MFLELLNDVLKTFYLAAKRFDKHPNIYILSSQEIGISKKINATSEKKSDKNYVFILGPLKSSFLSRFCFYCILFSVLGTTVAASMPPVMALWAESNPSQHPHHQ